MSDEELTEIEMKQIYRYLRPLLLAGKLNEEYRKKLIFLEKVNLTKDIVFTCPENCYRELFIGILCALRTARPYDVVESSYKLIAIDQGYLKDQGYSCLSDLVIPDILFICCEYFFLDYTEGRKRYIRNCIEYLVSCRCGQGKRTYIFSHGTELYFKKLNIKAIEEIIPIIMSAGEGGVF